MGKTRKKPWFPRANPSGVPSVKELESDESAYLGSHDGGILAAAVEKLKSASSLDRQCGAEGLALALVLCNKEAIENVLKHDIVRIAAPLLLDDSVIVRHSVAGSLRNLTAVGGTEVCEHFVQKDCLTPIVHMYKRFYQNWRPAPPKEGAVDSRTEIFIEVSNLLCNLCECSEQAVSVFNAQNLLAIFLPCLNVSLFGPRVTIISAQCLQAVTENNSSLLSPASSETLKNSVMDLINLEGDEPVNHLLRTLAAGIYLNLHTGNITGCPAAETSKVLEVLSRALHVSLPETVLNFKTANDELNSKDKPEEDLNTGVKAAGEELAKENIMNVLAAKQTALEVLTNICCDDDGADEWESLCSSEAGDDMEVPMEEDSPSQPSLMSIPYEIQETLLKLNLLQYVEDHCFIPEEVIAQLTVDKRFTDVLAKLETMQCRSLLCLHNMVSVALDMGQDQTHLHQLWVRMGKFVLATSGIGQPELLEATTGALRAIIQRVAEVKDLTSLADLALSDLDALYAVVQGSTDAKVRVNVLRVVAIVGALLAFQNPPQQAPLITSIGKFLLELGLKDDDVWVIAETADAIMDVFAEDHLEAISQQISLVQKCKHIHGNLKAKARQLAKQPGEHLPMVAMAKTNLSRFIKYKSKMTANGHG